VASCGKRDSDAHVLARKVFSKGRSVYLHFSKGGKKIGQVGWNRKDCRQKKDAMADPPM